MLGGEGGEDVFCVGGGSGDAPVEVDVVDGE